MSADRKTIPRRELRRFSDILFTPVVGILFLSFLEWLATDRAVPELAFSFLPLPAASFLPVPAAFGLWVRAMEKDRPFTRQFSAHALVASAAGFIFAAVIMRSGTSRLETLAEAWAVLAGLFVYVDPREALSRVKDACAGIALVAALSSIAYFAATRFLWRYMCYATGYATALLLHLAGMNVLFQAGGAENPSRIMLYSSFFTIFVNPRCSGLEGILFFYFALSVILLIDWPIFEKRWLMPLYLCGFFYMFLVNALRISLFFALGVWAWRPHAGWLARHMRTWPLEMFHEHVGWIFYLAAVSGFAWWLYQEHGEREAESSRR